MNQNLDAHESSLLSHLDLVESIHSNNNQATPRTVSRILESAQKLVEQFTTLRKQLVSFIYVLCYMPFTYTILFF
jgi:hypothetical protein